MTKYNLYVEFTDAKNRVFQCSSIQEMISAMSFLKSQSFVKSVNHDYLLIGV